MAKISVLTITNSVYQKQTQNLFSAHSIQKQIKTEHGHIQDIQQGVARLGKTRKKKQNKKEKYNLPLSSDGLRQRREGISIESTLGAS